MCFDARVQLLQIVNVLAEDLDILQAVLSCCSSSESKDGGAAFQPTHMHLTQHKQLYRLRTRVLHVDWLCSDNKKMLTNCKPF